MFNENYTNQSLVGKIYQRVGNVEKTNFELSDRIEIKNKSKERRRKQRAISDLENSLDSRVNPGHESAPSSASLLKSTPANHREISAPKTFPQSEVYKVNLRKQQPNHSTNKPQQHSLFQQQLLPQTKSIQIFQTSIPTLPSIIKQKDIDDKPNILKVLCCDRCDGKHETDSCPHYKKIRDGHIDAQKNGWKLLGNSSNLPGIQIYI